MSLKTSTYTRGPLPSDVIVHDPLEQLAGEIVTFKSNGSTVRELKAGTVIAKFTSTADAGKALDLTPAAENGTETAYGVVVETVSVPATGDATVEIRRSHTLVNASKLIWPAGISGPNKAAALAALEAKFLYAV